jgi:hypothetical protein
MNVAKISRNFWSNFTDIVTIGNDDRLKINRLETSETCFFKRHNWRSRNEFVNVSGFLCVYGLQTAVKPTAIARTKNSSHSKKKPARTSGEAKVFLNGSNGLGNGFDKE